MKAVLAIDTATTGPVDFKAAAEAATQPNLVQLGYVLSVDGQPVRARSTLVRPTGYVIPPEATAHHGITTEVAARFGLSLGVVLSDLLDAMNLASVVVAHGMNFDRRVIQTAAHRSGRLFQPIVAMKDKWALRDTMTESRGAIGGASFPTLPATLRHYFREEHAESHDTLTNAHAALRVFLEIERLAAAAPAAVAT